MLKTLLKIIIGLFINESKESKEYIPLINYLKITKYSEKETDLVIEHYKFIKLNGDTYIYKHTHTKECLEIASNGKFVLGKIDLFNHKLEMMAW